MLFLYNSNFTWYVQHFVAAAIVLNGFWIKLSWSPMMIPKADQVMGSESWKPGGTNPIWRPHRARGPWPGPAAAQNEIVTNKALSCTQRESPAHQKTTHATEIRVPDYNVGSKISFIKKIKLRSTFSKYQYIVFDLCPVLYIGLLFK